MLEKKNNKYEMKWKCNENNVSEKMKTVINVSAAKHRSMAKRRENLAVNEYILMCY